MFKMNTMTLAVMAAQAAAPRIPVASTQVPARETVTVVPQESKVVPEERWQVVSVDTGAVQSVHAGRAAARKAKSDGERVVDVWAS